LVAFRFGCRPIPKGLIWLPVGPNDDFGNETNGTEIPNPFHNGILKNLKHSEIRRTVLNETTGPIVAIVGFTDLFHGTAARP